MADNSGYAVLSDEERAVRLALLQRQLKADLKERFARNLKALRAVDPALEARYARYQPRRPFEFFCLENAVANLQFLDSQEIFYACDNPRTFCEQQIEDLLHSQTLVHTRYELLYDLYGQLHLRYVNQLMRGYTKLQCAPVLPTEAGVILNCVMLGCGLGYQLEALYSRVEVLNLILIEPDEDLFYASLHALNWASLLDFLRSNQSAIHFFIGTPEQDLFLAMHELYDATGRFLSGCTYTCVHYASPQIRAVAQELKAHNFQHAAMLGYFDDHLFATSHAVNCLSQGYHFVRQDRTLPAKYRKSPLLIVANGPSLDHDIPFLRRYQDKALILACGTAFETLYHAGIQPDFYGCTERTYHVAEAIGIIPDRSFMEHTIIVGGEVIHPETLSWFKHQALFIKPEEPFYSLIARYFPDLENIRPLLMSNPLVGNLGLAVAVALGFEQVYLFGLDNGRKLDSKKMHSEYSQFYKNSGGIDQAGTYAVDEQVEANFGGKCVSGKYFVLSLGSLNYLVHEVGDRCRICNCSDGARIEGTVPVHSEDLTHQFDRLEVLDKEALRTVVDEELTAAFPFDQDRFMQVREVDLFKEAVDRLIALFTPQVAGRIEFARRMLEAMAYLEELKRGGHFFVSDHLKGSLESMFIIFAGMICSFRDEESCVKNLNLYASLILYYLTDIRPLYEKLPDYCLGEHHKYFEKGLLGGTYKHSKAPPLPKIHRFVKPDFNDAQQHFVKRYE